MDDLASMARLIEALRSWLPSVVVVGGWAHRLHRYHPLASPPAFLPLLTRDADVAFSTTQPLNGDIAVALAAAGFEQELRGEDNPPIARYWLGDGSGFFAEFLAPLHGSGFKRDGTPDATVRKAGVTAQKLRYVDLLLVQPFVVRLGAPLGIPLEPPADVLLANPVSFIAQKLLIQKERGSRKKSQDMLYIHDTLELFAAHVENLREIWCEDVRPALPAKTAQMVERLAAERFAEVDDVIRSAARIPQDRTLSPQRVRTACAHGLEAIFGGGGA